MEVYPGLAIILFDKTWFKAFALLISFIFPSLNKCFCCCFLFINSHLPFPHSYISLYVSAGAFVVSKTALGGITIIPSCFIIFSLYYSRNTPILHTRFLQCISCVNQSVPFATKKVQNKIKLLFCTHVLLFRKFKVGLIFLHPAPALCQFTDRNKLIPSVKQCGNNGRCRIAGSTVKIMHQNDIPIMNMI